MQITYNAYIHRSYMDRGRQMTVGLSTMAICSCFAGYFFGNFSDKAVTQNFCITDNQLSVIKHNWRIVKILHLQVWWQTWRPPTSQGHAPATTVQYAALSPWPLSTPDSPVITNRIINSNYMVQILWDVSYKIQQCVIRNAATCIMLWNIIHCESKNIKADFLC